MRHPARMLIAVASLATIAGLTGCGTTVGLGANGQAGNLTDGLSDGLGLGTTSSEGPGATSADQAGGAATAAATPGASDVATNSASGGSYDGSGGNASGIVGPASKPIVIGVTFAKPASAGLAALGVSGTFGDQQHYAQIVIDDINAHGGLKGRKLSPVFFGYDANPGAEPYPQQDQAACASFTQDHHVELAWPFLAGDGLTNCLEKKGVPMVDGSTGTGYGKSFFDQHPLYVAPSFFNADRETKEWVKALVREQYFGKWDTTNGAPSKIAPVKIGIVAYDYPTSIPPVKNSLIPAVKALGYGDPKVTYVAPHDSTGDLGRMETDVQAAVLAFKAQGITHVLLDDDNGVMTLFFMTNAAQQHYRPHYGITSGNNMYVVSQLVGKDQLPGSIGIGWTPLSDLGPQREGGKYLDKAGRKACDSLMAAKGESGSQYNEGFALIYCQMANFTRLRYAAASAASDEAFVTAVNATGALFQPLMTPSSYVTTGHHDGLAATYDYGYNPSCQCMDYLSNARPLSH